MTGIVQSLIGSFGSVVSAVTDAYFNLVTLLLPGNGTNGAQNNTFLDSSTNNFTITRNGNTTQGTFSPFSQTGWSNYFDGSSAYLTVADNAAFEMTGDFTVECWVYPTVGSAFQYLVSKGTGADFVPYQVILDNANKPAAYLSTNGTSFAASIVGSTAATINAWNHIALVRSGTAVTLYLNGTSVGTGTVSGSLFDNTRAVGIGAASDGGTKLTGYLSNVRIVKGTAVYTSAFTVPTSPLTAITNTSLLTCQSNRFIDNSSNAFAITVNGTPSVQAFSPFAPTAAYSAATNGGSGYFDGSGDYLTTNNINLAANAFTIEGWFYVTTTAGNMNYWGMTNGGGTTPKAVLYMDNAGNLVFETGAVSGAVISVSISTYVKRNAWQHIAISRSGTGASQTAMFIDGVRVGTGTCASLSGITAGFNIGYVGEAFGVTLNGYVSGFRIVNGTAVYNPASTTVTIPTAPLTAITNTALLTNFTNAGITDATAKNDLETVGNAQISTTQSKFGGSSIAVTGGTANYLVSSNVTNYTLYGAFTIEAWVYRNSSTSRVILIEGRTAGGYANYLVGILPAGTIEFVTSNSANYYNPSTVVTNGQWVHVALVRNTNNVVTAYVNGVAASTTVTISGVLTPAAGLVWIGGQRDANSDGYIDDFRITQFARYTANFTPPTAAFPVQ